MELASLLVVGTTYMASVVAKKIADESVDAVWERLRERFVERKGRELKPEDASKDELIDVLAGTDVESLLQRLVRDSPALRRVRLVSAVFDGASVLWCDDNPSFNEWERALFEALGTIVTAVRTNEGAVRECHARSFDLVLSDIDRGGEPAGLELPTALADVTDAPVVFYVGSVDGSRGVPIGGFGITSRPDELVHLVCDVLERRRV